MDHPMGMVKDKSTHAATIFFLLIMFICMGLSCCRRSTTDILEIVELSDLSEALRNAGVDVQEGERTSSEYFGVVGRILFWDEHEIEVYEFSSEHEMQSVSENISASGISQSGKSTAWEEKPSIWASGRLIVVYHGYKGGIILLLSGLMGDPITYEAPAEDEPFPPAIVASIRHLAHTLDVEPGSIHVLDFTMVEWSDSCLEAPEPDEVCEIVTTPGWLVKMKVHGQVYEFRTDEMGEQFRQPQ
jgi:hypothetical protein